MVPQTVHGAYSKGVWLVDQKGNTLATCFETLQGERLSLMPKDAESAAYGPEGKHCLYGSTPGRWVPSKSKAGWLTWQILDQDCGLKDLAAAHIAAAANNTVSGDKTGILLLGDSAERLLVRHICEEWVGQQVELFNIQLDGEQPEERSCNRDELPNCCTCVLPNLRITKEAVWSVITRELPYNFHEDRRGTAKERTTKGLELFKQQFGGMPDLVLLQSAFWELATMWKEDTQNNSRDPQVLRERALPQSYLDQYIADVSGLITHLKDLLKGSETILVWRTTAYPRMHPTRLGWNEYEKLGQRSHLAELNAAARLTAERLGVPVIDQALMMEGFWRPEEYTLDNHHVKDWASYAHLNIMLNLVAQAKEQRGGAEKDQSASKS